MRKRLIFFFAGLLFIFHFTCLTAHGQLINNGGTIVISNGATILCLGNASNTSGTIVNDGKLEVHGSFTNNGTYNSTANEDSLLLTDSGAVTLNAGTSMLRYLVINKAGGSVTLGASTTVSNKLDFIAGSFSTDPSNTYELIAPSSAVFSFAPGTEITGRIRRTGWTNGTALVFNQPNMSVRTSGGTAPSSLLVNMVPGGNPSAFEREVKRSFYFAAEGGTGYTADVTFPYNTTELNTNTESNLVPWYYASSTEWNSKPANNTANLASHFISSIGIASSLFTNTEWKLADPRYTFNVTALLRGPWNGSTMNTSLNTGGLLPLSQPYNVAPFNYTGTESITAIPNGNVVDWVLVELRKPLSGLPTDALSSTIAGRKAGFLLSSGSIVDLDGATPLSFDITKQGTSFVVIRHLNHLGAMSNAIASNASGNFTNDFSSLANSYKTAGAPSDPVVLLSGGARYGLWAGDANKNGVVNATDVSAVKSAIAASASGYLLTDVNLSNSINATDVSLVKATISSSGTGSAAARVATNEIKTNIPK